MEIKKIIIGIMIGLLCNRIVYDWTELLWLKVAYPVFLFALLLVYIIMKMKKHNKP